jgi:hypothetical protein
MISVFGEASTVLSVMAEPPIFRITGFATFNYHTPLHEVLNHLLKSITENKKGHLFRRSKKGPTLIFCANIKAKNGFFIS